MIVLLSSVSDREVGVAEEDGYGPYCPCVIRYATAGLHLHSDFAPLNSPGWDIAAIDAQITWNLYTQTTETGGETTIVHHRWEPATPEDGRRGLPPSDLAATPQNESFSFRPAKGDVIFFNPRNPHKVAAGDASRGSNRISVGSFVGRHPDRGLIMWA
jgi:hypothetical protein